MSWNIIISTILTRWPYGYILKGTVDIYASAIHYGLKKVSNASGKGLKNLSERYQLLCKQDIQIRKNDHQSPYQSHLFMNNIQVAIIEDRRTGRPGYGRIMIRIARNGISSRYPEASNHPWLGSLPIRIRISFFWISSCRIGNSFFYFIEQACPTSLIIF